MGRSKGSKNKLRGDTQKEFSTEENTLAPNSDCPMKNKGRPVGAKNKPKALKETAQEIKRIKKEIKDLRTQKRLLPKGSEERIKAHRAMQELKKLLLEKKEAKVELVNNTAPDPLKEPIIKQILKAEKDHNIRPTFETLGIDLNKFSLTQLQLHLELITKKKAMA
jgi:hypothetical protein